LEAEGRCWIQIFRSTICVEAGIDIEDDDTAGFGVGWSGPRKSALMAGAVEGPEREASIIEERESEMMDIAGWKR
jgi:hypothetical protein